MHIMHLKDSPDHDTATRIHRVGAVVNPGIHAGQGAMYIDGNRVGAVDNPGVHAGTPVRST